MHRKCPGKNASIVARGTPSHPNRPDCPRQLRMNSQTAGQRPGRADADLRTLAWAAGAGGRGAELTYKKPRFLPRAGWSVLTKTHFYHGHFFTAHTAHIFFDKFSRAGWAWKKESNSKIAVTPYTEIALVRICYQKPILLTTQAQNTAQTSPGTTIDAYIRIIDA